jgi:isopenicillin-N epimerase
VPVDIEALGADFYSGNAHKWLMAPKGAGFLHARPQHQERIDAAIVSWGYAEGTTFQERIERQGTRDPAAWLAVPAAIRYQGERDWDTVRARCRVLAHEARAELCDLVGTEPLAPAEMLGQMASVRLPRPDPGLRDRLFTNHRVEIPVAGPDHDLLRISVAAYTTRDDVDRLLEALAE